MRFNTIVTIAYSGVGFAGAVSNCTSADYALISALNSNTTGDCFANRSDDNWATLCFTDLDQTCGDDLDGKIHHYIDNTCDIFSDNDFQVCKSISVGIAMAMSAPGGSHVCNNDDTAAIADVNMTDLVNCADSEIIFASGCLGENVQVSEFCGICLGSVAAAVELACQDTCAQPDSNDMCGGCVNGILASAIGGCTQSSSTGLSGLFALTFVVIAAVFTL